MRGEEAMLDSSPSRLCVRIMACAWPRIVACLRWSAVVLLSVLGAVAAGLSALAFFVLTLTTWLLSEAVRSMSPPPPASQASLLSAADLEVGLISDSRAESVVEETEAFLSPTVRWQSKQAPSVGLPLPRLNVFPVLTALRKRTPKSAERCSMTPPSSREDAFCLQQSSVPRLAGGAAVVSPQSWQGLEEGAAPAVVSPQRWQDWVDEYAEESFQREGEGEDGQSPVSWAAELSPTPHRQASPASASDVAHQSHPSPLASRTCGVHTYCGLPSPASACSSESLVSQPSVVHSSPPVSEDESWCSEHTEDVEAAEQASEQKGAVESEEQPRTGDVGLVGPSSEVLAKHAFVLQELQLKQRGLSTGELSSIAEEVKHEASFETTQQPGHVGDAHQDKVSATGTPVQSALQRLNLTEEQMLYHNFHAMGQKGLAMERERVRQELNCYEEELAKLLSRAPQPEEKEEMRPLYIYYWRVKEAMANAEDDACSIADASTDAGSVSGSVLDIGDASALRPVLLRSQVGTRLANRVQKSWSSILRDGKLQAAPDLKTSKVQRKPDRFYQQLVAPPCDVLVPRPQLVQPQPRPWR